MCKKRDKPTSNHMIGSLSRQESQLNQATSSATEKSGFLSLSAYQLPSRIFDLGGELIGRSLRTRLSYAMLSERTATFAIQRLWME